MLFSLGVTMSLRGVCTGCANSPFYLGTQTMQPFFADYLERLGMLQGEIDQALAGLSQDAIDWPPGPGMNSIGVLVAHVAGSTQYWIGDVIGRGATQRVRATEFQTVTLDANTLRSRLAASVADSEALLATLTEADLTRRHPLPGRADEVTAGWALLHALEHMATHVGHIQLTRQWWEQQHDR